MRIAKWTSIIVGSIVLLLVITAFVMTSLIDPNRYRGKVEAIVGDLAGRPLVIEGNLQLTWYPWLGMKTGPAHLDNPPGVLGPPIAEWGSVTVAAKLLPLLKGQVVVDRIRLQSPHIHLHRDAQGHGNWENLGPRSPRPPAPQSSPPQIAGLEVTDGMLDYEDEMTGRHITLSDLELGIGEWQPGKPLPIHTRFLAHSDSLPPNGVWVQADAPKLTLRRDPLNIELPQLSARIADAQIKGSLVTDTLTDAGLATHGSITVNVPSVRKLAHDLALDQTLPHDPTTLGALALTSQWSYAGGALSAKPLNLKLDGVTLEGWLQHSAPPRSAWDFELHGDHIDLNRYVKTDSTNKKPFELPLEALRAMNANGSLLFDQADIAATHLTDVRLKLQTPETKQ
ncbi:MAG: AsmA family protein [Steroidobacteraceae bacterium]